MALYFNLPVYKDGYRLLLLLFKLTGSLPREFKFTVGEKLRNEVLELIIYIYMASKQKRQAKRKSIEKARDHLEVIRLLTRVLNDLDFWGVRAIVPVNLKIEAISKQLSQWARYTARVS